MPRIDGAGAVGGAGRVDEAASADAASSSANAQAARPVIIGPPETAREAADRVVLHATQGRSGVWYSAEAKEDDDGDFLVTLRRKLSSPPFTVSPDIAAVYHVDAGTGDIALVSASSNEHLTVHTKEAAAQAVLAHVTGKPQTGDGGFDIDVKLKDKSFEVSLLEKGVPGRVHGTWSVAKETGDIQKIGYESYPEELAKEAARALGAYVRSHKDELPKPWAEAFCRTRGDADGVTIVYNYEYFANPDGKEESEFCDEMQAYLENVIATTPHLRKYKDIPITFYGPS